MRKIIIIALLAAACGPCPSSVSVVSQPDVVPAFPPVSFQWTTKIQLVSPHIPFLMSVSTSQSASNISTIEFYVNGSKACLRENIKSTHKGKYFCRFTPVASGTYGLQATETDKNGAMVSIYSSVTIPSLTQ